jgi:hypothetical protein
MTTYDISKLSDAKILADKPITQGQGRALRDNLLAVIEGDPSAPQIQLGAIAFGSDIDGSFVNGSTAPTAPGFFDYEDFTLSTPKTFPCFSCIRVQGDFTLSDTLTIAPMLLADYDLLRLFGTPKGNDGEAGGTSSGGGGCVGAGGSNTGAGGAAIPIGSSSRLWVAQRGIAGGFGGVNGTGVSKPGGALFLFVNGDCDLSGGTIDASGAASTCGGASNAAGGGGGSIYIVCRGAITAGTLKANGGGGVATVNAAAGGGGGRIHTVGSSYPIGQTLQVTGGTCTNVVSPGAAGSTQQDTLTAARILGLLYR